MFTDTPMELAEARRLALRRTTNEWSGIPLCPVDDSALEHTVATWHAAR